jgi:lipopolysaccharide transport system ATP-binding protein
MSEIAIRVEGLGKQYRIGGKQEKYRTLRDTLTDAMGAPFRRIRSTFQKPVLSEANGSNVQRTNNNYIWALKDVSFEVKQGEVIGIIGRNGAGKSTLLKILSRITEPTEGYAEVHGRVGSLLEVGTGFHPELTGRENIYLNGAILGMKKAEIDRKFDEIVAFAEVERFIDTPVKHYSSGMYLRLAFAVAAHLEPEILLVDEVLAVGDVSFQKKCLGKMQDVAGQGRTVLFVSHSMPAIQNLCHIGIVLREGRIQYLGPADQAVQQYINSHDVQTGIVDLTTAQGRFGSGEMRLLRFWVEDETRRPVTSIPSGSRCYLAVEYASVDGRLRRDVSMSIHINTIMGAPISLINTYMLNQNFAVAPPRGYIRFEIPKLPLTAGRYVVDLNLATHAGHTYADFIRSAAAFDVDDGDFYGTGRPGNVGAPVLIEGQWSIEEADG